MQRKKFISLGILVILLLLSVYFIFGQTFKSNEPEDPKQITPEPVSSGDDTVVLMLGGDVMLGRNVMQTTIKYGDYSYPFGKIFKVTGGSDMFFVNLENPIIENCPAHLGGFKFCAPPEMIVGLKKANINIVTLANNHNLNYGRDGLMQTIKYLEKEGISSTGINEMVIKEFKGITIGFIGFDFTVNIPTEIDYQLVGDSDPLVDYLIVGVHWGNEYEAKAGRRQREWAREIVSRGADIIVGHHPHWVQDYECIDTDGNILNSENNCNAVEGKPVYYSLGNLVFDQMWSEETKKGMLVRLVLNGKGIVKEERYDTYMRNIGQPEIGEFDN